MKHLLAAALAAALAAGPVLAEAAPVAPHHDQDRRERRSDDRNRSHDDRRGDHRDRDDVRQRRVVVDHRRPAHRTPTPKHRVVVQRYRAPVRYAAPVGHRVQRWRSGQYLPAAYYARPYHVDHRRYGLRVPPRGHDWVRVDNDVVLVALATGLVSQVVADLFY
ncbi:RcnB family protein [Coralloluteibacterium stylophorae]|uniref:RcnB family protein n=1 Tax=Coralloluteibacterium stylophorae TaxID=1776034 RepID=A0A8J7VUJ5_9GAMM|nr:RcnB family protein [Coralloluteibacterium stylophorae]MBS7455892.1 RcnB family protein [Coralloluteibacterium stylophorae]